MGERSIFIVGAKQGIGLVLSQKFKARGWTIYGSVRSKVKDEEALGELAAVAQEIYEINLENEESIKAAATAYGDRKLDVLLNCAGSKPQPDNWWDHTAEIFTEKLQVNVVAPFLTTKYFYPVLQKSTSGKIINISTTMASMGKNQNGGCLSYRVSKTAINQMCVTMAREFLTQGHSVTINAIDPGWIPTKLSNWTGPDDLDVQTTHIVNTIEALGTDTGRFMNAQGEDIPF